MTREESITYLEDAKSDLPYKFEQALNMAIEALQNISKPNNGLQGSDLISRTDAIRWVKTECNPYGKPTLDFESGKKVIEHLEQMPSADEQDDNRLYIKIYANDEPSRKAEKLYQICGETESQEVAQWLKEYFPSADRPTGEWVLDPNGMDWNIPAWRCSKCGFVANYIGVEANGLGSNPMNWAGSKFCPNCGAKMGGDNHDANRPYLNGLRHGNRHGAHSAYNSRRYVLGGHDKEG